MVRVGSCSRARLKALLTVWLSSAVPRVASPTVAARSPPATPPKPVPVMSELAKASAISATKPSVTITPMRDWNIERKKLIMTATVSMKPRYGKGVKQRALTASVADWNRSRDLAPGSGHSRFAMPRLLC